jgi:hypothetical protein
MLWDGSTETVGPVVEYDGQLYAPGLTESSILRELMLPTRCCPHGTTREFLMEICKLVTTVVGVDEKTSSLVARIVLCSAIVEAVSVAPALVIAGPDTARANRLVSVLRCLCRHSVPLTSVTPASFCSLEGSARYTFLISQANISVSAKASRRREHKRSKNSVPRSPLGPIWRSGDPERFRSSG